MARTVFAQLSRHLLTNCFASVDDQGMTPRKSRGSRFEGAEVRIYGVTPAQQAWQTPDQRDYESALGLPGGGTEDDSLVRNDSVFALECEAGGWRVQWSVTEQDGVFVMRSLKLEPTTRETPPGGVTTNLLRELSPQRDLTILASEQGREALDYIAGLPEATPEQLKVQAALRSRYIEEVEAGHRWPDPLAPDVASGGRPPGRPRVPDAELAAVAEAYLRALSTGQSGVTTVVRQALEATFGYEPGAPGNAKVRDRIRMCRERGWLTAARRGSRGGSAGPELLAWRVKVEEQ